MRMSKGFNFIIFHLFIFGLYAQHPRYQLDTNKGCQVCPWTLEYFPSLEVPSGWSGLVSTSSVFGKLDGAMGAI